MSDRSVAVGGCPHSQQKLWYGQIFVLLFLTTIQLRWDVIIRLTFFIFGIFGVSYSDDIVFEMFVISILNFNLNINLKVNLKTHIKI
jgi:hypothetical protein